ncbi:MAG: helix-turn-helix domain-containing protein [Actinomycetota bacterium]|nr:helix-turn-helix domain-containing protein [Actinomycetota bacterium]
MTASALIRRARESAGMTQAELAAAMGVSQPVVARFEGPTANPTYSTLERALSVTGHTLALARSPATLIALDLGQLRERLAMTPHERLRVFTRSQQNLARLTGSGHRDA